MIAVIFEVSPAPGREADYLALAGRMLPMLDAVEGFVSVERFRSLADPAKILSLSFFADEAAVTRWRTLHAHRGAQQAGRAGIFDDYRLRVATVSRDYGLRERDEAPPDSRAAHGRNGAARRAAKSSVNAGQARSL